MIFSTPSSRNARARADFLVFCTAHKECVELNAKEGVFGDTRVRALETGAHGCGCVPVCVDVFFPLTYFCFLVTGHPPLSNHSTLPSVGVWSMVQAPFRFSNQVQCVAARFKSVQTNRLSWQKYPFYLQLALLGGARNNKVTVAVVTRKCRFSNRRPFRFMIGTRQTIRLRKMYREEAGGASEGYSPGGGGTNDLAFRSRKNIRVCIMCE